MVLQHPQCTLDEPFIFSVCYVGVSAHLNAASASAAAAQPEESASPRSQQQTQPGPPSLPGLKEGSDIPLPCAIIPTDCWRYELPVKRRWWRGEAGGRAVGGGWGAKTAEQREGEGEAENREPKRYNHRHRCYYYYRS
ncbi:hypothetical protein NQZ68_019906 [Dissostichus eleginoides]|nr:hypothetical protein NQZ68_019906 [Dissostichus eleginoides]